MKLNQTLALCSFFMMVISSQAQICNVFPQPNKVTIQPGKFQCVNHISIVENEDSRFHAAYLVGLFQNNHSLRLDFNSSEKANVQLTKVNSFTYSEGYDLQVTANSIEITYSSREGFLNAMQTLNQLIEKDLSIPLVQISDEPAFQYRGMHLDCARHFFSLSEIKALIDQMAKLKLNRFHWHLTDDQGWRIEIKKYPKLTEVGAWRDSTLIGHYSKLPIEYQKKHYGGFYTQEQAKELIVYAKQRGIEIVPEIEMPGHASAAISAYPELSCQEKQIPVAGTWGVFNDVFCSQPATRTFLKNVLEEVMAIFPYPVIHIGGDECPKVEWNKCEKCQQIMRDNKLKDAHELQSFFIKDIETFVNSKGKKIIGWDEILEGGLAPNAQVMSWRGPEGGQEAAKLHHDAVMCPVSHCYLDYYQSGHPSEPLAIGGYLPLDKVYRYNPLEGISSDNQKYILGGQANLWTEYIPTIDRVQYQLFPRLVAMSEVLWNKSKLPYNQFVQQLADVYLPQLEHDKINYATSFLDPALKLGVSNNGLTYVFQKPIQEVSFYLNNQKSDSLFIAASNVKQKHVIEVQSQINQQKARPCSFEITSHLALGKKVYFTTLPSEKYNHNGNLGLTDGVLGSIPWKGNEWLGFDVDTIQFVLDLEKKTQFSTIELGTLHDPGSWIYRPHTWIVETSSNNKAFKKIDVRKIDADFVSLNRKMKARYVRITVINNEKTAEGMPGAGYTPWTFINEIILTR